LKAIYERSECLGNYIHLCEAFTPVHSVHVPTQTPASVCWLSEASVCSYNVQLGMEKSSYTGHNMKRYQWCLLLKQQYCTRKIWATSFYVLPR